jgi:hypothetical protein
MTVPQDPHPVAGDGRANLLASSANTRPCLADFTHAKLPKQDFVEDFG